MSLDYRPATQAVFDDVVEMLGPKRRPDAQACWCLTYRLGARAAARLDAGERRERVFELCGRRPAPGILSYAEGEVVGWAGVAPRSQVAALQDPTVFPRVDDADPWSMFERAGFVKVADTRSEVGGAPRVVMRLTGGRTPLSGR